MADTAAASAIVEAPRRGTRADRIGIGARLRRLRRWIAYRPERHYMRHGARPAVP